MESISRSRTVGGQRCDPSQPPSGRSNRGCRRESGAENGRSGARHIGPGVRSTFVRPHSATLVSVPPGEHSSTRIIADGAARRQRAYSVRTCMRPQFSSRVRGIERGENLIPTCRQERIGASKGVEEALWTNTLVSGVRVGISRPHDMECYGRGSPSLFPTEEEHLEVRIIFCMPAPAVVVGVGAYAKPV